MAMMHGKICKYNVLYENKFNPFVRIDLILTWLAVEFWLYKRQNRGILGGSTYRFLPNVPRQ